jgi:hypothetical protein
MEELLDAQPLDGEPRQSLGSHRQGQGLDKEVSTLNRIAEVSAELALYRILIRIDEIVEHYSNEAIMEIEAALWKLLREMQVSPYVAKEANRNHRIE